jgi:hypothetical protein
LFGIIKCAQVQNTGLSITGNVSWKANEDEVISSSYEFRLEELLLILKEKERH